MASLSPLARSTGPAGWSGPCRDARRRRRTRLGSGHPAVLTRGLRQVAFERDRVPVLRTHRDQPGTVQVRIRDPHPGTAARGRCENRIKTLKKYRPGQAALLRLRREPRLGQHRRAGLQSGLLAPARRPHGRPPGQGLGHQTLALPALRNCRENHHPCPPLPAPAPRISARERPPETPPGHHSPPHQRPRSLDRLTVDLILYRRTPRSPEVEPAPTQANQQATPDCPKTENNSDQPRAQACAHS